MGLPPVVVCSPAIPGAGRRQIGSIFFGMLLLLSCSKRAETEIQKAPEGSSKSSSTEKRTFDTQRMCERRIQLAPAHVQKVMQQITCEKAIQADIERNEVAASCRQKCVFAAAKPREMVECVAGCEKSAVDFDAQFVCERFLLLMSKGTVEGALETALQKFWKKCVESAEKQRISNPAHFACLGRCSTEVKTPADIRRCDQTCRGEKLDSSPSANLP